MLITDRIDAVTKITEDYLRLDPPAPRSVKIEITGKCNYRCSFCALRTRAVQPKGDMDFALFQNITRQMHACGVEEIGVFYLGESCSAPDLLVNAIKHVKATGFPYCFLTTNGSLMTPELADRCMAVGLDSMKFSINAADAVQFKSVMAVKSSLFYDALANLRAAYDTRNRIGYPCGIYASSIKYDGEQQQKMERLIDEKVRPFVDEHYWLPLYSMGSLATTREEELGYKPIAGNQGRLGALRDPLPCWSAFTEGHVTADGILSACCFDADSRWGMGDLNSTPFINAWNSAKFQALRAAHLAKDVKGTVCEECVAYA